MRSKGDLAPLRSPVLYCRQNPSQRHEWSQSRHRLCQASLQAASFASSLASAACCSSIRRSATCASTGRAGSNPAGCCVLALPCGNRAPTCASSISWPKGRATERVTRRQVGTLSIGDDVLTWWLFGLPWADAARHVLAWRAEGWQPDEVWVTSLTSVLAARRAGCDSPHQVRLVARGERPAWRRLPHTLSRPRRRQQRRRPDRLRPRRRSVCSSLISPSTRRRLPAPASISMVQQEAHRGRLMKWWMRWPPRPPGHPGVCFFRRVAAWP